MALNDEAKKWVAALRSGKFKQGRTSLVIRKKTKNGTLAKKKAVSYCCLGVAERVVGKKTIANIGSKKSIADETRQKLNLASISGVFKLNNSNTYTSLVHCNDQQKLSFSQIADIIESEPEGLFIK